MNKQTLINQLNEMMASKGVNKISDHLCIPTKQLEVVVLQLEEFGDNKVRVVAGDKPFRLTHTSERITKYRARMAEFIKNNTGVVLPVNSNISTTFYNTIADYFGL